jgi:hypothetical protein
MKRALTLLSLILTAACASKDGFIENTSQNCGSGSEVIVEAGWDMQGSAMESGTNRVTMLVRVSNLSDHDITVKRVYVDPLMMNEEAPWELERGATDPMKVIAEGDASTFEVPMIAKRRRQITRNVVGTTSGAEVAVTVLLEPEQTYRCRFRVPMGS